MLYQRGKQGNGGAQMEQVGWPGGGQRKLHLIKMIEQQDGQQVRKMGEKNYNVTVPPPCDTHAHTVHPALLPPSDRTSWVLAGNVVTWHSTPPTSPVTARGREAMTCELKWQRAQCSGHFLKNKTTGSGMRMQGKNQLSPCVSCSWENTGKWHGNRLDGPGIRRLVEQSCPPAQDPSLLSVS